MTKPAALALALFAFTLALYWPVGGHAFVSYDDYGYVKENPSVAAGLTAVGVRWSFTTFTQSNWHPLTWLSHMLDAQLFGLGPGGHHRTSAILHAGNAVLVLLLLLQLSGRLGPSALVAALFAVHPLNVESVAWVAQRKTVLSTALGLLALSAYVRWGRRPAWPWYALALALFALSLLAKPMLVTLPFVLLLLDRFALGRWTAAHRARLLVEKLPFLALSAASSVVTVVAQRAGGAVASLQALPLTERIGNAAVACVTYLLQAFWPAGLAVFYPHPQRRLAAAAVAACVLLLVGITLAVWRPRHSQPYLPLGWLWYLGTLVPVIGLVQVGRQAHADRYAYVPLIGVFVMVAWGLEAVLGRRGPSPARRDRALLAAAAGLALVLAWPTRAQIRHWKDTATLFTHAQSVTGPNAVAEFNLGLAEVDARRWPEAIARFSAAVRLDPRYADAYANLGAAHAEAGDLASAIPLLERAARLAPSARTEANLAIVLARARRPADAAAHFRLALAADPSAVEPRLGLGFALLELGQPEEAERAFAEALARRPASGATVRSQACGILLRQSDLEGAARQCTEALRLEPRRAEAHDLLGSVLVRKGDLAGALDHFRQAVEAAPGHGPYLNRVGMVLLRLQRIDEAEVVLREAVARQPADADAHTNLGTALLIKGRRDEGLAQLQEALRLDPHHATARGNLAAAQAGARTVR